MIKDIKYKNKKYFKKSLIDSFYYRFVKNYLI